MRTYISNQRLSKHLIDRGLIPPNCRLLDVVIDVDGVLILRYEVFVDADQLALVAAAMADCARDAARDDERNAAR